MPRMNSTKHNLITMNSTNNLFFSVMNTALETLPLMIKVLNVEWINVVINLKNCILYSETPSCCSVVFFSFLSHLLMVMWLHQQFVTLLVYLLLGKWSSFLWGSFVKALKESKQTNHPRTHCGQLGFTKGLTQLRFIIVAYTYSLTLCP